MYSLKRSFKWVRERLWSDREELLPSETFVHAACTIEKLIRREMLHLVMQKNEGFTLEQALAFMNKPRNQLREFGKLRSQWKNYDPRGRTLKNVLGKEACEVIEDAAQKRNKLVHGLAHEPQKVYAKLRDDLLDLLPKIHKRFSQEYRFGGWKGLK